MRVPMGLPLKGPEQLPWGHEIAFNQRAGKRQSGNVFLFGAFGVSLQLWAVHRVHQQARSALQVARVWLMQS